MARQYTQEQKDRVLGALMASAVAVDGGWKPDFLNTAISTGVSHATAARWWHARDQSRDVALRAGVARAGEELAKEGASGWYADLFRKIEHACQTALDPSYWEPVVVPVEGRGPVTVGQRPRPPDLVKAAQGVADLARPIAAVLGYDRPTASGSIEEDRARLEALRGAAIVRIGRIIAHGSDKDALVMAKDLLDRTGIVAEKKVDVGFDMEMLREFLGGNPEKAWEEGEG